MDDIREIVKELREMSRMIDVRLGEISNQLENISTALFAEEVDEDDDDDF